MHATKTIILGGGFGGIATATSLRQLLPPEHDVILVERKSTFHVGATKTWVMLGERTPDQVTCDLRGLARRGIQLVQAEVQALDPERREVRTSAGTLQGDFLVLALGAELNLALVPGLAEAAQTFYTWEGALRLRTVLPQFTRGELVMLIPAVPFKCPPGPYEAIMLLHDYFQHRGCREQVHLSLYTVEGAPMATAGPQMGEFLRTLMLQRGIDFHPQQTCVAVEAASRHVVFAGGNEVGFDLLLAIPPHVAPGAVRDCGLVDGSGWIPVDPHTMQTSVHRVYAIGDVARVPLPGRFKPEMPLVLPKAGVFAEAHGIVVAAQIAAQVMGGAPPALFDGRGQCHIETGAGLAARGEGEFFALPHPRMQAHLPDATLLAQKQAWVADWVQKYLG